MSNKRFTGAGVALVTPFNEQGDIDIPSVHSLVEWHLESGTDMILPSGTTGEAATLSKDEFAELVTAVLEVVDGRIPVIPGTGTNSTAKVIEMSQLAQSLGADGVLVVSPYYNKPTQAGLYEHYKAVAESIEIPVVMYNVPGRTSSNISAETQLRLAEIPNIVATKEASGNFKQIMHIIDNCPDDFSVLSGDDSDAFSIVALGGDGVVSVVANEMPAEMSKMIEQALSGNFAGARELHYTMLPLMEANFFETNPIPVKTVLAAMGKIQEKFRLPMVPIADENRKKLLAVAKSMGLIS
ncbi:MAG: 4-hydroxy-tetrahydrodipicolinate synthase [Candidatus Marinimicrobia bacterium]|nr:4-hydroxy-tetrahydrodipicolinate synthase [Candidatus Neomarinimicrobiota bacterium]MCF7830039.1 4-hydroxy-tetrahydrodipicolinate synthase [Candidatus Neomarinimicrobiota bacterium]MCF7881921.1 4-hydroxy-tetrahydrodipicolinate synthase [Candidatus Neomarinimicrobiota bacterium]